MITRGFSRSVATAAASGSQRTASLRLQLTGSSTGSSLAERTPGVRLREEPSTPVSRHPAALPQGRQLPVLVIRIYRIRMFLGLPDPDPDPLVRSTDRDPAFLIKVLSGLK
jgi:hypothetical protein